MICFSETYLDSTHDDDDPRFNLKDFTLIRADNSHNCKRDVVFLLKNTWLFAP